MSRSCGCLKNKPKQDLTGKRFGKLTVLGIDESNTNNGLYWRCLCDCGNIKLYKTTPLTKGKVISCGCENKKKSSDA